MTGANEWGYIVEIALLTACGVLFILWCDARSSARHWRQSARAFQKVARDARATVEAIKASDSERS
jgi:hypothetical protein